MCLHCLESDETQNVVMAACDVGLSTVDDVKKNRRANYSRYGIK
jgi:hypothetical protein